MSYTFPSKEYEASSNFPLTWKDFLAVLRSAPVTMHLLGSLALLAWIGRVIYFYDASQSSHSTNASITIVIAPIFDGIFSAIVAGYVFFILFALLPEYEARKKLAPFIFSRTASIVGDCSAILSAIANAASHDVTFSTATKTQVGEAFSAVGTQTPAPMIVGPSLNKASWFQYFSYHQTRTRESISLLYTLNRFLDADLVFILTKIDKNIFFLMNDSVVGINFTNKNLGAWGDSFFNYAACCRELAVWHNEHCPPGVTHLP